MELNISTTRLCDLSAQGAVLNELLAVRSPGGDVDERAMPGDHIPSGWWRNMVGRYLLASHFVTNSDKVLDMFTGYGWGAWLVQQSTGAEVRGIDCDSASIQFAHETWSPGPTYEVGDCIESDPPQANVVCAMEALEHLTDEQAEKLIGNISKTNCRVAILSSIFPATPRPAPPTSPSHKRLFARNEVREMFGRKWAVEFTKDCLAAVAIRSGA